MTQWCRHLWTLTFWVDIVKYCQNNKIHQPSCPSRPQSVPQPMVSGRHHPHPFRLGLRLHTWRFDLPVPEGLFLHGPDLLTARLLSLLHVWPQPERGWGRGSPVWELHRQADRVLGACGSELLSSSWNFSVSEGFRSRTKDINKCPGEDVETSQDLRGSLLAPVCEKA